MIISQLKGIGKKTEELLNRVGISDIHQLIHYYPKNYETFESPASIAESTQLSVAVIEGVIVNAPAVKRAGNLQILTTYIRDSRGDTIKVTWFNMPFLKARLKLGYSYIFRGRMNKKYEQVMEQPSIFTREEYELKRNQVLPLYGLTKGLANAVIVKAVKQVLETSIIEEETLPESIRAEYDLVSYEYALKNIHFPSSYEELLKARKRLAFDEFFFFIYTLKNFNQNKMIQKNKFQITVSSFSEKLLKELPYSLTGAQMRTLKEVRDDLCSNKVMSRLIQGDVGSGKTIIAILALIDTAMSGYQGALMVPTEVLANQHFETVEELFQKYGISVSSVLLTGSMSRTAKRAAYERIESGEAGIIIGTHALIQENVVYHDLALVITDEQHRFGVRQREMLSQKGDVPNILVMSATPIPRTLALILYGDLDISLIDEQPADRLPIKNCVVGQNFRENAYRFIQKEVEKGRQAYIICPMIEESETVDAENVTEYEKELKKIYGSSVVIESLHGKMSPNEKNEIMQRFFNQIIQVLVSTTVIEVGINVPNATVIMIENAERFGLAALHQLRGRVGRGKEQSYCILVSGSSKKETLEKLEILNRSNDGFVIAEEDLKTRGPGDLFGVRQSGEFRFKAGDIYQDAGLIKKASEAVELIYEGKWALNKEEMDAVERKCQLTKELLML